MVVDTNHWGTTLPHQSSQPSALERLDPCSIDEKLDHLYVSYRVSVVVEAHATALNSDICGPLI